MTKQRLAVSVFTMLKFICWMGMMSILFFCGNHMTSASFTPLEGNYSLVHRLAMEDVSDFADLHKFDPRMLNDFLHYYVNNRKKFEPCKNNAVVTKQSIQALSMQYINSHMQFSLPIGGMGIVSLPRKRATCLLTKLALTLPEGDLVETGCFIGTSAVMMLHILKDFDTCQRKLWVFDSFEGLPPPSKEDKAQGQAGQFDVTIESFTTNMKSQNLMDPNLLVITKGWFRDTLPVSNVKKIAFLRLDGDLFESTWDAITALYDRVVPGGVIYVDDFGSFVGCATAIERYRTMHKIYEPLHYIMEHPLNPGNPQVIFEAVWWVKRYEE